MDYVKEVEIIIPILRDRRVNVGYERVNILIEEVVNWLNNCQIKNNKQKGILNNINRTLKEVLYAVQINDIVYLIDLIRYELYSQLIALEEA